MKMNKLSYLLAAAIVPLVSGCTLDNVVSAPEDRIHISAQIEPLAKAPSLNDSGSGIFTSGDVFTLLVAGSRSQAAPMEYRVGSTNLYWKDVPVTADEGAVGFYACYPKQTLNSGNGFTFDLEQADEPDLLLASTKNVTVGTSETVTLQFSHVMHRLVVNFTVDPSYKTNGSLVVNCTAKSACTVNLVNGTVTSNSKTATFTASGETATFMLVPQEASAVTFEVQAGSDTKRTTLQELVPTVSQLESGKQLTLNLSVKDGAIQLQDATISGWGNQGTVEGEIVM